MLLTLGEFALEGTSLQRPKPLLLLTYVALEGPTSRRKLSELFYGDAKDPLDSLATALGYLRRHPESALEASPKTVSTTVFSDVSVMFEDLAQGRVEQALIRYRGPFLTSYDLALGEELEDWVYAQQDRIAQRLRGALLDYAGELEASAAAKLAERAWALTRDQGMDASSLNRLYALLVAGKSPGVHDVRRFAGEYGIPITTVEVGTTAPAGPLSPPAGVQIPQVEDLVSRLEDLRYSTYGLALCLWGEAGVGKSWTLEQVRSKLSFASYFLEASLALKDVPQRLPRAAALPQWARTVMSRMASAQAVQLEDTADAVAEVLAIHAPVVLQVEDLHDASPERVRFWNYLAKVVKRSPGVALIATSRGTPPDNLDAQKVSGLNAEQAAWVLEREAGSTLPLESMSWIYDRAAGNPLFSLEYLRYLRRRGHLWHDSRAWRWRPPEAEHLPATVESLISQAIQDTGLSESARTLVHVKALLPATASHDLVRLGAGLNKDESKAAERQLADRGILRASGDAFAHPLYAEGYVQGLSLTTRRQLALLIVTNLGESDPVAAAAFVDDADQTDAASCDLLLRAAAVAAQGRLKQAGDLTARAAMYTHGEERIDLLLKAAGHLRVVDSVKARELVEQVLLADTKRVEARLLLAECLVNLGEGERAEAMLSRVEDPSSRQRLFELLVRLRTDRNDYPGAVALWESRPDFHASAPPEVRSRAAISLAHLGRFEDADRLAQASLDEADASPQERASLYEVHGVVAYYSGRLADALGFCNASVDLLREAESSIASLQLMQVLRLRTAIHWAFQHQKNAIDDTEEAMKIASTLGSGRAHAIAQIYLGVPLTEIGEYERAEEALIEGREVLRRADAREHLAACEALLGGVYLNWQLPGMRERALGHTRASLKIAEEIGSPVIVAQAAFYAAWAELIAGDADAAVATATRSVDISREIDQRRSESLGCWILGLALEARGDREAAAKSLGAAVDLAVEMGLEGHRLMFILDLDRLKDDKEAFKEHLSQAEPYNFSGYQLPARQLFRASLGL